MSHLEETDAIRHVDFPLTEAVEDFTSWPKEASTTRAGRVFNGKTATVTDPWVDQPDDSSSCRLAHLMELAESGSSFERISAIFLDTLHPASATWKHVVPLANALLECLTTFIRSSGGRILRAVRPGPQGQLGTLRTQRLVVDGAAHDMLREGALFAMMPEGPTIIAVEEELIRTPAHYDITIRSVAPPGDFMARWSEYARRNCYLRGRACLADGSLLEHKTTVKWEDVVLEPETRAALQRHVVDFLANRRALDDLGVKARRGVLLAGPPGTGKTLIGKVLSDLPGISFIWVMPESVSDPDTMAPLFELARFLSPTIIYFEDIDLLAPDRQWPGSHSLGELMNQLDGAMRNDEAIVAVASTNRLEVVEEAISNRPGRFDRVLHIMELSAPRRRQFIAKLFNKAEISVDMLDFLVAETDGFTGARLEELANTILMISVEQLPTRKRPQVTPAIAKAALAELATTKRRSGVGFTAA